MPAKKPLPPASARPATRGARPALPPEPRYGILDRQLLLQAGGVLFGRDFQNAVQIQREADQDLVAGVDFGKALQQELADELVVADVLVLALIDRDHRPLPVDRRRC